MFLRLSRMLRRKVFVDNWALILLLFLFFVLLHYYLSHHPSVDQPYFHKMMKERSERKNEQCQAFKDHSWLVPDKRDKFHYYAFVIPDLNLLWCPVYKAASTSWLHNFMILHGLTEDDIVDLEYLFGKDRPTEQFRSIYPTLTRKNFQKYEADPKVKKVIIVRHPFSRLVSAYRDKIEKYRENFYFSYSVHMMKRYRERAKKILPESAFKTVLDIDGDEVNVPTFWEFVQHILDLATKDIFFLDEHWRPMSRVCDVCSKHFDYILKFENMEWEQDLFGKDLGFQFRYRFDNRGQGQTDTFLLVREYFKDISHENISALYDLYRFDFLIFDYSVEDVLDVHI